MKFKNILDPVGQVSSLNKMDNIFKIKSLNNSFCSNDPCIVVFAGDSAFLYLVIKWTVSLTRVWVKMLPLL